MTKDLNLIWNFVFQNLMKCPICFEKEALFGFLTPIVAEKINVKSRVVFMAFFAKLQYCLV